MQLMGEKDLYDYWSDTYKIHTLDWSRAKAADILAEWQAKFSAEVERVASERGADRKFAINAYSTSHLDAVLKKFSEFDPAKLVAGYAIVVRSFITQSL